MNALRNRKDYVRSDTIHTREKSEFRASTPENKRECRRAKSSKVMSRNAFCRHPLDESHYRLDSAG